MNSYRYKSEKYLHKILKHVIQSGGYKEKFSDELSWNIISGISRIPLQ